MKRKFTAAKEAKRRSREMVGILPCTKVILDKRKKPTKHRKPINGNDV